MDRPEILPMHRPFGLSRDPWGRLTLIDADGRRHEGVRPVPAFPLSDPGRWVSICDARGQEIVWVEDVAVLPEGVRRLLEEELADRDFQPRVERIRAIDKAAEGTEWHVETDHGPTVFRLESDDSLRVLNDGRVLLTDVSGVRYVIPDPHGLDAASRRRLERHL